MDFFFYRIEGGKVKLAWCNSRSQAGEFLRVGWTRIEQDEYERLDTARIERRLSVSMLQPQRKGA